MLVILLILLMTTGLPAHAAERRMQPAPGHGTQLQFKELLVSVTLNHIKQHGLSFILQDRYGRLWLSQHDVANWHLPHPELPPLLYKGQGYYPLAGFIDLHEHFDASHLALNLQIPAHLLPAQTIDYAAPGLVPQKPNSLGGFFNYDVYAPTILGESEVNGYVDGSVFGPLGVVSGDVKLTDALHHSEAIRLNTTWTWDQVDKMRSIRVGDTITQAGMWGRTVGFGGIQISTNFATRPNVITYPLPNIGGEAVYPSLVDVYINNALVLQKDVRPGPFSIRSLPVLNGNGDISLVTKDVLGRERVVTVPYYASNHLLRQGLNDYSIDLGFVREDFGLRSNDYDRFVSVVTWRRGLTQHFTGEFHLEAQRRHFAMGFGGSYLFNHLGIFDLAGAISRARSHTGGLLLIGVDHDTKNYNLSVNAQLASKFFRELGQADDTPLPSLQSQVYVGIPLSQHSSVGFSLVARLNRDKDNQNFLSANYAVNLGHAWSLTVSGLTNLGGEQTYGAFATLSYLIGDTTTLNINGNYQNQTGQGGIQLNHSPAGDTGLGYYFSGLTGGDANARGGVNLQTNYADLQLETAYQQHQANYSAELSGGIATMHGQWWLSRHINDSFGVVQIPGYAGMGVYVDNQLVARTNNRGYAVIPDLRPYQDNVVQIHPTEIPLNTTIKPITMHAVPYYHSGIFLPFRVQHLHASVVNVVRKNGLPIPAGAAAYLNNSSKIHVVGYHGELYLPDLAEENDVIIRLGNGRQCHFHLSFKPASVPIAYLGNKKCMPIGHK